MLEIMFIIQCFLGQTQQIRTSLEGKSPPSKTVSTGPDINASHSKKFSSEIGPAKIPEIVKKY